MKFSNGISLYNKQYSDIRRFAKKYIFIFVLLASLLMIFTPEILLVLGGKSYMRAVFVMPPIACGCICQFLYTMFVNVEQFSKKTIGMAVASASAAIVNYVLNLIFIPKYGYIAAAYTTLFGFLWLLVVHMYLVYRYGLKQVYPYRFIVITAIFAILVTIGISFLYWFSIARYIFGGIYIAVICFIGMRHREAIFSTVKNMIGK